VVRCRVVVTGRVQGVFYRQSCRREAVNAGVGGWVRNTPEGTVEAVLEGEDAAVGRVVAWMRIGPPHAVVTDVQVTTEAPVGERNFSVR